ncbi:hypothetical protein RFI_27219 [Reticulomyxa filosa]|uniref:DUF4833 domain-containing protein n=1 Tax=Reticulomyxa filosa TaxID=46433 RepID=X6M920_RETFI|nr:hypothetical protein RFI_27219 [Reticulomyxa filosa]|eukprot:ETO10156.1 hypothetical protein RFI_27219 [Reticulomyxa filosa]
MPTSLFTEFNKCFFVTVSPPQNYMNYIFFLVGTFRRSKKKLNESDPLEVFWLKIEPSYIKSRRKQGYKDDRSDLTFLENQMAYGVSIEKTKNGGEFKVTFVALSGRPLTLRVGKDGLPHCYGEANGKPCILKEMFVNATENFIGLPSVNYVEMKGVDEETGGNIVEKVVPK